MISDPDFESQINDPDLIIANRISKTYKVQNYHFQALSSVSFRVSKNERITIRGDNGCGKSTLLRILATLVRQTDGEFSIFGSSSRHSSEIRSKIGYVPELLNFDYSLNPKQMWNLVQSLRGGVNNLSDFEDLIASLKMKSWLDKPIGSFSLGMKKRFMMCLWLSLSPQILLLDEYDSGLDEQGRGLVEDLLKSQENLTILSITHTSAISLGKYEKVLEFKDICEGLND